MQPYHGHMPGTRSDHAEMSCHNRWGDVHTDTLMYFYWLRKKEYESNPLNYYSTVLLFKRLIDSCPSTKGPKPSHGVFRTPGNRRSVIALLGRPNTRNIMPDLP